MRRWGRPQRGVGRRHFPRPNRVACGILGRWHPCVLTLLAQKPQTSGKISDAVRGELSIARPSHRICAGNGPIYCASGHLLLCVATSTGTRYRFAFILNDDANEIHDHRGATRRFDFYQKSRKLDAERFISTPDDVIKVMLEAALKLIPAVGPPAALLDRYPHQNSCYRPASSPRQSQSRGDDPAANGARTCVTA